jgi:hypothetical protein
MEIWAEWPDKFAGLKIKRERERERVKSPSCAGFEVRERGRGVFWDFFLFFNHTTTSKNPCKGMITSNTWLIPNLNVI